MGIPDDDERDVELVCIREHQTLLLEARDKRIDTLVSDLTAKFYKVIELERTKGQLEAELERANAEITTAREEAYRETAEERLQLLTENALLKSKLYDYLLEAAEPVKHAPFTLLRGSA